MSPKDHFWAVHSKSAGLKGQNLYQFRLKLINGPSLIPELLLSREILFFLMHASCTTLELAQIITNNSVIELNHMRQGTNNQFSMKHIIIILHVGRVNGMVDFLIILTRLMFCALKFGTPLIRRLRTKRLL